MGRTGRGTDVKRQRAAAKRERQCRRGRDDDNDEDEGQRRVRRATAAPGHAGSVQASANRAGSVIGQTKAAASGGGTESSDSIEGDGNGAGKRPNCFSEQKREQGSALLGLQHCSPVHS